MDGLITAAGLGTRSGTSRFLRKEMLPLYDQRDGKLLLRPVIDCAIYRMKYSGISNIYTIVDPADRVTKDYLEEVFPDVGIIYQHEKKGFGDAVYRARDQIKGNFVLNAGDGVIVDRGIEASIIKSYSGGNLLSVFRVSNPSRYGTVEIKGDSVTDVVEKSSNPPSNLAIAAFYILDGRIFDYIDEDSPNAEISDAIKASIESGIRTRAYELPAGAWISVGIASEYYTTLEKTYRFYSGSQ